MLHDLQAAVAAGAPGYTIPQGLYNFSSTTLEFTLTGATSFALVAEGVTLIFAPRQGLVIANSTAVCVRGLTIDYAPVGFTQGKASDVVYHEGKSAEYDYVSFTLALDEGYPSPTDLITGYGFLNLKTYFYAESTRLMYHSQVQSSPEMSNATEVSPRVWRIFTHIPSTLLGWHPPAEGTLATLSGTSAPAILASNCSDTLVEDVTLYHAAGMGYLELSGGGGTVLRRWRAILPPPSLPPLNRLLATTLDGVHSTSVERGLTLVDSVVSFAGDDLFAVHCELGISWGPAPDGALYIIDTGGDVARTVAAATRGTQLLFFALNATMDQLGEVRVSSISVEPNATLQAEAANCATDIKKERGLIIRNVTGSTLLLRVVFESPLPPAILPRFAALVQNPGRCGFGTRVLNTSLHDSSGGMRLKGINVTVDGCSIANVYGARLLPEPFWTQSESINVTISNNVFVGTGNAPAAPETIEYDPATSPGLSMYNNSITPAPPPG